MLSCQVSVSSTRIGFCPSVQGDSKVSFPITVQLLCPVCMEFDLYSINSVRFLVFDSKKSTEINTQKQQFDNYGQPLRFNLCPALND